MLCPLCQNPHHSHFHSDKYRRYYQCSICKLVFVPPQYHLSSIEEKKIYDLHQNSLTDQGYLQFLNRFIEPLKERLNKNATGLDFGSGPTPVLATLLKSAGYDMEIYDIYYARNENVFEKHYDFICCTEVIEHLQHPKVIIEKLLDLLTPKGVLGIMTKRVINAERFANWHYKNDPTHICFFSTETFEWIAEKYCLTLDVEGNDVVFLTTSKK
jgi:SAM-dependent methyltransferase